jgi:Mn2+/Fe2+ NRAMP family transporter
MKTLMVMLFVCVLVALASAGVFMLRKGNAEEDPARRNNHMARALAVRVGLSVALFLFILLSWYMGWVRPTGIPVGA